MLLNVGKTQAIVIDLNDKVIMFPPLWLNGSIIPYSSKVKNLGMIFNNRLNWNDHAELICNKIYNGLRSAWPHYEYCSIIFSYGLNAVSKELLNRAFHAMVRFAYGVRRFDSISSYVDRLLGFNLEKFFKIRAMCFIHKLIRTETPAYLKFITDRGRSRRTNHLVVPRHFSQNDKNTIASRGVVEWNSLPNDIRSLSSYYRFRKCCANFNFRTS